MSEEFVDITVRTEGPVGWITFNRPHVRNAFHLRMWHALERAVRTLDEDPGIRVLVLTGAGDRAFAAGADLTELQALVEDEQRIAEYVEAVDGAVTAIQSCRCATIAMINGYAIGGGCEIAISADLRLAGRGAILGVPAARWGIGLSRANLRNLVSLVGPARARYIVYTAEQLPAEQALAIGLVEEVVADAELLSRTRAVAERIAGHAPLSVAGAKETIHGLVYPGPAGEDALPLQCFLSRDFREGLAAFREKRSACFTGR